MDNITWAGLLDGGLGAVLGGAAVAVTARWTINAAAKSAKADRDAAVAAEMRVQADSVTAWHTSAMPGDEDNSYFDYHIVNAHKLPIRFVNVYLVTKDAPDVPIPGTVLYQVVFPAGSATFPVTVPRVDAATYAVFEFSDEANIRWRKVGELAPKAVPTHNAPLTKTVTDR